MAVNRHQAAAVAVAAAGETEKGDRINQAADAAVNTVDRSLEPARGLAARSLQAWTGQT